MFLCGGLKGTSTFFFASDYFLSRLFFASATFLLYPRLFFYLRLFFSSATSVFAACVKTASRESVLSIFVDKQPVRMFYELYFSKKVLG